jgi:hypothetical protein
MIIIDINGSEREVISIAPDPKFPGYLKAEFKRHAEWYTLKEFIQFNPTLKHLTEGAKEPPQDVVGYVTKAGPDFLIADKVSLTPQAHLGMEIWISRGKGEGQQRQVVKNTKNRVTVDKPWDTLPDTTSQFVISQTIMDVPAMGNTLPQDDMRQLEKRALAIDRERGHLTPDHLKKYYHHLKPEDLKN